jgi:RHS repeat-associated protein
VERDYVYRDGLLLAALKSSGAVEHYSLDHLGTPRLVTDGAGHKIGYHVYWPFGEEWSPGDAQEASPLKFTGHERDVDPTGGTTVLDYMHARYYGAAWGRFLSVDPIVDITQAPNEPQMWNRYSYVTDNPLKFTDADGRYRDGYFEKPYSEWGQALKFHKDTPAVVKGAFYAEGALLGAAAVVAVGSQVAPAVQYMSLVAAVRFPTLWNLAQSYLQGETGTASIGGLRAAPSAVGKAEKTAAALGMTAEELVQQTVAKGGRFIDQSHGTINILMKRPDGRDGFVRVTVDITGKVLSVGLNRTRDVRNQLIKERLLPK